MAVHECLFCPQTFDSAAAKDDHILQHFPQEICMDCNQNLIRIGSNLYTLHDTITCIKREVKMEHQTEHVAEVEYKTNKAVPMDDISNQNRFEDETVTVFSILATNELDNIQTMANPIVRLHMPKIEMDLKESDCFPCDQFQNESDPDEDTANIDTLKMNNVRKSDQNQLNMNDIFNKEKKIQMETRLHFDHFKCDICKSMLKNFGTLRKHMKRKHQPKSSAQNHLHKTKQPDPIPCEYCGMMLANKSSLRKHQVRHHSAPGTLFCKTCGKLFTDTKEHEMHMLKCIMKERIRQSKNSTELLCETCQKQFKTKRTLRKHKIMQHSAPGTLFCKVCGKLFTNLDDRDIHAINCITKERIRQSKSCDNLWCDTCQKKFKTKRTLRQHKQKTHNKNSKCRFCHLIFTEKSLLTNHHCKRKEQELMPCEFCGKILASKKSLRKHRITVHNATGTVFL